MKKLQWPLYQKPVQWLVLMVASIILLADRTRSDEDRPNNTEQEFKVHYWYGFPNTKTYTDNKFNARTHFYRQMSQILELYEAFPENNDISAALALTIVQSKHFYKITSFWPWLSLRG